MASRWARPLLKRFTSTSAPATATTYTSKPLPSKTHLHAPIPDSAFPKGYSLTGLHAGVKKKAGVLDLGLILSHSPASAAACFTRNAFKAAPVLVSQEVLATSGGRARGVVVNSGCANAVTGAQGLADAWAMVRAADGLLTPPSHAKSGETLVLSTGVIGQTLPIAKIVGAIREQAGRRWARGSRRGSGLRVRS